MRKTPRKRSFYACTGRSKPGNLKEEATGYMHATVHSVTVDTLRRRTSHGYLREVSLDGADDAAEGDGYSAATSIANEAAQLPHHAAPQDEALFWREGVAKLVDTLRELPEVTQQVFILYHFEGLSHQQIVHRLGVPLRSVERHMAKALAYCRERLGDYL